MKSYRVSLVLFLLMLVSLPLHPIHQAAADSYTNSTFVQAEATYRGRGISTVEVTETQPVVDLNIEITFMKPAVNSTSCDDPGTASAYNYDTDFWLYSPQGAVVVIVKGFDVDPFPWYPPHPTYYGFTPGGKVTVLYDDEAALSARSPMPVSGTFRPYRPLSLYDEQNPAGTWTLVAVNPGTFGLLCLFSFTLFFGEPTPPPPPSDPPPPPSDPPPLPINDGRINASDKDSIPPFVIYCDGGSIKIYGIDYQTSRGWLLVAWTQEALDELGIPDDVPLELAHFDTASFWRLPTGEFQGNGVTPDGKPYIFVWDGCPATSTYHLAN